MAIAVGGHRNSLMLIPHVQRNRWWLCVCVLSNCERTEILFRMWSSTFACVVKQLPKVNGDLNLLCFSFVAASSQGTEVPISITHNSICWMITGFGFLLNHFMARLRRDKDVSMAHQTIPYQVHTANTTIQLGDNVVLIQSTFVELNIINK